MEHGFDINLSANFANISLDTARRWLARMEEGLDVVDAPRSGRSRIYDIEAENRFIGFYCQTTPLPNSGRWTLRWAEAELLRNPSRIGISPSHSTMQRILNRHNLKPHRVRYFLQITDPDFFPKMEELITLYRNPPKNLFCFDECPGIQILQRIVPDLRPTDDKSINMFWQEFEYIRNGTTDLFCFLDVNTGKMSATCHSNHTKEVFTKEFRSHVMTLPQDEDVHYVMDNLSTHCCYHFCEVVAELSGVDCPDEIDINQPSKRREWLQNKGKRIVIHFTPFHGSWLNQAETCFRIIREKCFKDSYNSPEAIIESINAFIVEWNLHWAHPFDWKYDGKGLHEKAILRIIATFSHSASKMTLQYLTKSFGLIINLLEGYEHEVNSSLWTQLFEVINKKQQELQEFIRQSTQPRVKVKAEKALEKLISRTKEAKIAL